MAGPRSAGALLVAALAVCKKVGAGGDAPPVAWVVESEEYTRLLQTKVTTQWDFKWCGQNGAECAAGGPGSASHRRDCHSAALPSPFSRCFNTDGEGTSVN